MATSSENPVPISRAQRLGAVAALLILSPYCAEFLIGYQGGYVIVPHELLLGVLFASPLYGTVAVLIREAARRTGRGWPTILLLSCAFGVIQAGLIDQSLFNHGWLESSIYWEESRTLVPGLSVDVHQFLVFVGGHTIWSFAAPIAVVEAMFPKTALRPWLGPFGTGFIAMLYLGAAAVFYDGLVRAPGFKAEGIQLFAVALVAAILIVMAFVLPRLAAQSGKPAPRPALVGAAIFLLLGLYMSLPEPVGTSAGPWAGAASGVATLILAAWLLWDWSGRSGWNTAHVIAAAGAPLILYALMAFVVPPIGGISLAMKYASNCIVLTAITFGLVWIARRNASSVGWEKNNECTKDEV